MIKGDIDLTENLDFYHDKKSIETKLKSIIKSGVPWYTEKKNIETLQSKLYKYLYSYYYNDSINSSTTAISSYNNGAYTYSGAEWNNLSYTYTNSYYYSLESIPESYSISINYDNAEDVYEIFDYINDHDLYINSQITNRVIDDKSNSDKLPWGNKEYAKSKLHNKTDYNHHTYTYRCEDMTYKTIYYLGEDKHYKINKQIRRNEEEARSAIENDVHKFRERHRLVRPYLNALLDICKNPKNIYDDNKRDEYGEYWYDRYDIAELSLIKWRSKNRRKRYNIRSGRIAPWLEKLSSRIYEDYIADLNEEQDYTSYLTNMGWLGMH